MLILCTYTKHIRFHLPLPVISLPSCSQSVSSSSSHSLLTFLSSYCHSTTSSVPSIVLNIQHFVKPSRVTSGEMWCHAIVIHWQTSLREFKFGIINLCDTIWNAGCACSPLPYVSWTLTNHNWLYSLLSSLIDLHVKIWQCRAWFGLAQSGSVLHTCS